MREIKFRVWFENVKRCEKKGDEIIWHTESYYDYDPIINNNGLLDVESGWDIFGNSDENYFLEQYTGLKDKNGKEIYEGDIVDDGYSHICKIRWSEHFTAFEAINENDGYMTNIWFIAKYGEVIGNIHENSELLKKENKCQRKRIKKQLC